MPILLIEYATLTDPGADDFIREWTTSDDHTRANRFRGALRRSQCLMARALLRHALYKVSPESGRSVTVAHDADGRPYPMGDALQKLSISLAHSGSMIAAAVSDFGLVGIDVEDTRKERCFSAIEHFISGGVHVPKRPRSRVDFYFMWTASEAFIKAGHPNWLRDSPTEPVEITASDGLLTEHRGSTSCISGTCLVGSYAMSVAVFPTVLFSLPSLKWSSITAMPLPL
jgi:4'-phosphopantetheinyl transferase EntD